MVKSLWGELLTEDEVKPPITILKEQAAALAEVTKGVLTAEVSQSLFRGDFQLELRVIAPALSGYEYSMLHAKHRIDMYPVKVRPGWTYTEGEIECEDAEQLEAAIATILSSNHARRVVHSLLVQSKANSPAG